MNVRLLSAIMALSLHGCGGSSDNQPSGAQSGTQQPPSVVTIISSQTLLAQGGNATLADIADVSFPAGAADNQLVTLAQIKDNELVRILDTTAQPLYDLFTPATTQLSITVTNMQPGAPVSVSIYLPADIKSLLDANKQVSAFILARHNNGEERISSAQPVNASLDQHNNRLDLTLTPDHFSKNSATSYQAAVLLALTDKSATGAGCGLSLTYPVKFQANQHFGDMTLPDNTVAKHYGLDFPAPAGTPVMAMASGIISAAGNFSATTDGVKSGWGNYLIIRHNDGSRSLYSHLAINNIVPVGSFVSAGDVIGESGNSSGSLQSHLHIEFLPATGVPRLKIDPSTCFNDNATLAASPRPDPIANPDSAIMLDLPDSGTKPAIDYRKLPIINGEHIIISALDPAWNFKLHNYLAYHDGKYWMMWSRGSGEDRPGQHVQYTTSLDGVSWTPPVNLVDPPGNGYAYIARGFWVRNNELLALAAHFVGPSAFGVNKDLQLQAFSAPRAESVWPLKGMVANDSINNFPPKLLPNGQWMMIQRDSSNNTSSLIGGLAGLDDWQLSPIITQTNQAGISPDEPLWWDLPSGALTALLRDNSNSYRLFRSFSSDNGLHWTIPVQTNFPGATSKFYGFRTSKGYWLVVSNANPAAGRQELYLSTSLDGLTFTRMAKLAIDAGDTIAHTYQYPHALEQDGTLLIAVSRDKNQIELLRIPMATVDHLAFGD